MGAQRLIECFALMLVLCSCWSSVNAQLNSTFYDQTCPEVFSTVKAAVKQAIANETRMAASLLRLHFHDYFVNVRTSSPIFSILSVIFFPSLLPIFLHYLEYAQFCFSQI
ncbi:hypothetical protein SUGI_0206660 [Cryptomeria japonica]|nr:hypothetical protein SUGI_0206660 [Cryptomeria japonica]